MNADFSTRGGFSLARDIVHALGGDWHGHQGSVPGFGHSPHDRSVSLCAHPNDASDVLINCFNGADPLAFKDELRRRGLLPERAGFGEARRQRIAPAPASPIGLTDVQQRKQDFALRIWEETQPSADSIAETYIRETRGIDLPLPPALRFHPRCPRGKGRPSLPALVATITNPVSGEFKAIHRIFLRPDGSGKADLPRGEQKMSLGPTRGGAVVLVDLNGGDVILEGEGIETVLTACWLTGLPGIATLSASTLGRPPLQPGCAVTILADRGAEDAAQRAAELRLAEGREVKIALPPDGCKDFNDAVRRGA